MNLEQFKNILTILNNKAVKMEEKKKKGRGWHGDSAGHAKAGSMGGKARANKKKKKEAK